MKALKVLALLEVFVLAGFGLDGLALRGLGFEGLECLGFGGVGLEGFSLEDLGLEGLVRFMAFGLKGLDLGVLGLEGLGLEDLGLEGLARLALNPWLWGDARRPWIGLFGSIWFLPVSSSLGRAACHRQRSGCG